VQYLLYLEEESLNFLWAGGEKSTCTEWDSNLLPPGYSASFLPVH